MKYCKACNRYWENHRIVCPECLQSLPDNLIEEQAGTAVPNDKFIEKIDKMFNRQILKYTKRIAELEKPILCAKCNGHIIADDGAVCEICADTMDTIITELQARIAELEAKISAANGTG